MRRRSSRALLALALLAVLCAVTFVDAQRAHARRASVRQVNADLVRQLGLTDLSLVTEARYTRHPSQADGHSAFQDGPGALEHFPSGSLIGPGR